MKRYIISIVLILSFIQSSVFADTVITVPIDSRPISTDYLGNLVSMSNDDFICIDKEYLDYFSANNIDNKFAESKKIREELKTIVEENNNEESVVIINTSSYMTGGLVGSRCGTNYNDCEQALEELYELITENDKPSYYINLSMPRTLPEIRLNEIWRDEDKIKGIGGYYLKYNDNIDDEVKDYIIKKLYNVTPIQFIMEWSYIENKKSELGQENLTNWEKDFLNVFNKQYKTKEPYKSFLYKYKLPYYSVSNIFYKLIRWQDEGLIDEIVISNDDFQLPDSIVYLSNNTSADWINVENGTPIKYSFARSYMTTACNSISKQLKNFKSEKELQKSLEAKADNINFIFGTDEVPQLIYARSFAKRNNITTDFDIVTYNDNKKVDTFDVLSKNQLLENAVNFVSADLKETKKKTNIFMYDYDGSTETKVNLTVSQMQEKYDNGDNVSLVEIYNVDTLNSSDNKLFKKLAYNANQSQINIADLSAYSAWNTNANAIGLGVASAQVYGINEEINKDYDNFIKAHIKVLGQHLLEDGIYTVKGKRLLSNQRFIPSDADLIKSEKLYSVLEPDEILKALENKNYVIDDQIISSGSIELKEYYFPWRRTFECFVDVEAGN